MTTGSYLAFEGNDSKILEVEAYYQLTEQIFLDQGMRCNLDLEYFFVDVS